MARVELLPGRCAACLHLRAFHRGERDGACSSCSCNRYVDAAESARTITALAEACAELLYDHHSRCEECTDAKPCEFARRYHTDESEAALRARAEQEAG